MEGIVFQYPEQENNVKGCLNGVKKESTNCTTKINKNCKEILQLELYSP